jgi:PAS domain S-box-containing protein
MILADSAGAILLVNREAQDMLGRNANELIGQSLETVIAGRHSDTHAVEVQGYLDTASGQLIRRRRRRTVDICRSQSLSSRMGANTASADRRMLVVSIRNLVAHRQAEQVRLYDRRLKSLREIGAAIRASRAPDIAAQTALRHIRRLVPCTQAAVLAFDREATEALVLATFPDCAASVGAGARLPLGEIGLAGRLRRGKPDLVGDIDTHMHPEAAAGIFKRTAMRSVLRVPLVAEGRLVGTIDVAASEPNSFEESHVLIMCEVADQLAIALQTNDLVQQVQATSERLRALSRQLMEIQENERQHIARELHDEIGQSLTAVKINLETILRLPDKSAIDPHLHDSIAIVERVLQQVRAISLDLRPSMLDDLGLESALRWYVGRQAQRAGFAIEFSADLDDAELPPEIATTCFRIVQEALTNVVRYAQAQRVWVDVRRRGAILRLIVRDDGIGFDLQEAQAAAAHGASLGLVGMQERVLLVRGELRIESAPGRGVTIRVHFPIAASD